MGSEVVLQNVGDCHVALQREMLIDKEQEQVVTGSVLMALWLKAALKAPGCKPATCRPTREQSCVAVYYVVVRIYCRNCRRATVGCAYLVEQVWQRESPVVFTVGYTQRSGWKEYLTELYNLDVWTKCRNCRNE